MLTVQFQDGTFPETFFTDEVLHSGGLWAAVQSAIDMIMPIASICIGLLLAGLLISRIVGISNQSTESVMGANPYITPDIGFLDRYFGQPTKSKLSTTTTLPIYDSHRNKIGTSTYHTTDVGSIARKKQDRFYEKYERREAHKRRAEVGKVNIADAITDEVDY